MIRRLGNYVLLGPAVIALILVVALAANRGLHEAALESDYMAFLTAGKLIATGQGNAATLYDRTLQASTQQALLAGSDIRIPGGLLPFVNPPIAALPFALLSYLPVEAGFIIWNTVQMGALLVALWLLRTLLSPDYRYLLWLGATVFMPIYLSVFMAQFSPLLLLSITLLWRALQRGGVAGWWGGAALGIMLLKPQLLPLFLIFLIYRRSWRALGGFVVTSAGVYLLTSLFAGFAWPGPYLDTLVWYSQLQDQTAGMQLMPTLSGLLVRLGIHSDALLLTISLSLLAAFIYACWRSDLPSQARLPQLVDRLELQLAAALLVATFTSLHLHPHDLLTLIFSGAVLLGWEAQRAWPAWISALLLLNLLTPLLLFLGPPIDFISFASLILTLAALLYLLIQPQPASRPAIESAT